MPEEVKGKKFDFIYCFDVFVHTDSHIFYKTLQNLKPLLADDETSRVFVSVSNICSKLGFERFAAQKEYKVQGFFFQCNEMALKIID